MAYQDPTATGESRLILPFLRPVWTALNPIAETLLRVLAGGILINHGWPKIQNPTGMAGWLDSMGFAPGWFWSTGVAATEFFGGILLVLGLLTRPAAFAALIVLLVVARVHWVDMGEGFSGAEFPLLWAAVMVFFVARGGGPLSVDRAIGKQF